MHLARHSSTTALVAPGPWDLHGPLEPHERGRPIQVRARPIARRAADRRVLIVLLGGFIVLFGVLVAVLWTLASRKGSPRS